MGIVALPGELATACRDLGLEGVVEFAPRVPRAESLQAMMNAAGLLLLQPGHAIAVPAKVYEYLAAERPIFALAEGESAMVVERSGMGVVVSSDQEDAIVDGLQQFLAMAERPLPQSRPELFDGSRRAAEITALLADTVRGSARAKCRAPEGARAATFRADPSPSGGPVPMRRERFPTNVVEF